MIRGSCLCGGVKYQIKGRSLKREIVIAQCAEKPKGRHSEVVQA
jgi:hypothetical protein